MRSARQCARQMPRAVTLLLSWLKMLLLSWLKLLLHAAGCACQELSPTLVVGCRKTMASRGSCSPRGCRGHLGKDNAKTSPTNWATQRVLDEVVSGCLSSNSQRALHEIWRFQGVAASMSTALNFKNELRSISIGTAASHRGSKVHDER